MFLTVFCYMTYICTVVCGPKSKNEFVPGQNPTLYPVPSISTLTAFGSVQPLQCCEHLQSGPSKRRNVFVRNFQRFLGTEFAIDDTSFVQYYASLQK